jgi:hypothetical protein
MQPELVPVIPLEELEVPPVEPRLLLDEPPSPDLLEALRTSRS